MTYDYEFMNLWSFYFVDQVIMYKLIYLVSHSPRVIEMIPIGIPIHQLPPSFPLPLQCDAPSGGQH